MHAARCSKDAPADVWIMPRSDERRAGSDPTMNMYGTTLRQWDAATQSWRIAWTNPVSGHHEEQVGRWNGRDILQEGSRPDGTKTRWTFTEITNDAFRWRGEALYPNGSSMDSRGGVSRDTEATSTSRSRWIITQM